MENRGQILEQEKKELQELNEQLQAEINSLRRMASIKDSGKFHQSVTRRIILLTLRISKLEIAFLGLS